MSDIIIPQAWRHAFRGDKVKSIRPLRGADGITRVRLCLVEGGEFLIQPANEARIKAALINTVGEALEIKAVHELTHNLTKQVWVYGAASVPQFGIIAEGASESDYLVYAQAVPSA